MVKTEAKLERGKVFVSSAIGGDVDAERSAVIEVIDANPYLRAWDFGREPAAPGPLAHSYLKHVDDCALFIAVIGSEIRGPVEDEFNRSEESGREILVFRKRIPKANERVSSFLRRADVKYASFETILELRDAVQEAIDHYIAALLAQSARPTDASRSLLQQLRKFAKDQTTVPAIPREFDLDLLRVEEATPDTVRLHKNSGETIWIAISQIVSVRPTTPADSGRISLRGRLQWLLPTGDAWTTRQRQSTVSQSLPGART